MFFLLVGGGWDRREVQTFLTLRFEQNMLVCFFKKTVIIEILFWETLTSPCWRLPWHNRVHYVMVKQLNWYEVHRNLDWCGLVFWVMYRVDSWSHSKKGSLTILCWTSHRQEKCRNFLLECHQLEIIEEKKTSLLVKHHNMITAAKEWANTNYTARSRGILYFCWCW